MEDEEGVGLILARATELRLKISDCIDSSSTAISEDGGVGGEDISPGEGRKDENFGRNQEKDYDSISSDDVEEAEAERLLHIRDALESLESQLAALQNLRQRQQYEKQVALSEIDYSRKMLLEKLKEYKGKDFEVLRETSTFAGERVDYENDLLLPPYPIHPPISLGLDNNGYLSHLPPKKKSDPNGFNSSNLRNEAEVKCPNSGSGGSNHGVIRFLGSVAKIVLPIIGVISILSASGYGPEIRTRGGTSLKLLGLLPQQRVVRGKKTTNECPPGKFLVVEDGESRCLVKERVEIPFDSVVSKRDVTYGYG